MNGRAELPFRWGALQQLQDIHLAAGVPMENVTRGGTEGWGDGEQIAKSGLK
ncbi:hypothetical protein L8O45_19315 [Enterobacter bugandensis]|nr:hypothetical protein [Enterobacter bugandensis]MCK7090831.1 hypothetical protein [Enterobacter bugandensis]